jgi:hypothetical protein
MARSPRAPKEEDDRLELVWAALTNPRRTIGSIQLVASEHGFRAVPKRVVFAPHQVAAELARLGR